MLLAALAFLIAEPTVSELGIEVGPSGLAELKSKVRGREDASCQSPRQAVILCVIGAGGEVYQFTETGHPAHPSGYFLGFAERDGTWQLEERGWTAQDDEDAAQRFFTRARSAEPAPQRP